PSGEIIAPSKRAKEKQAVPAFLKSDTHCLPNDIRKTLARTMGAQCTPEEKMPASRCLIRTLQSSGTPDNPAYPANILYLLLLTFHKWRAFARKKGTNL